jgi:hypothetical protein
MLSREHSDIRREAAEHTNEIVKEGLKGDYNTQGAIKDTRYDVSSRIADSARVTDSRFFDVGRDTQDIRAQIVAQQQQIVSGFLGVSKDAEINSLKTQIELSKQSTYLSDKMEAEGEKTRALLVDFRDRELQRELIERNTWLAEERHHGRFWRHGYDNAQWNALQSNLNAFQSQLQETRQGMVNFGTMSGNSGQQSSTSNNVR